MSLGPGPTHLIVATTILLGEEAESRAVRGSGLGIVVGIAQVENVLVRTKDGGILRLKGLFYGVSPVLDFSLDPSLQGVV